MAKKLKLNTKNAEIDNWLDGVTDDQRKDLKDFVGKDIEILKGFVYESKKFGKGFTFLFKIVYGVQEFYTTNFGVAVVRQAEEEIISALKGDSVIVKVAEGTSKTFGTKYLYFDSAE